MKRLRPFILVLFTIYTLYLIKSAVGINISSRYHAGDVFKMPIRAILQAIGV